MTTSTFPDARAACAKARSSRRTGTPTSRRWTRWTPPRPILRSGGALSSPSALRNLLQVAQQNIAVDAGFNLAGFVDQASTLTDRSLSLYTLPISEFGQDSQGGDVNIVDVQNIRAIVHNLFTTGSANIAPST